MTGSESTELLESFRSNPWEYQRTFETPLKNLQSFVEAIVSTGEDMRTASLALDQAVFEPKALIEMLTNYSIQLPCKRGLCLTAVGKQEIEVLLRTVLSEWIDFLFVPEPASFAIYADHDEYTSFYAHDRVRLDRLAKVLSDRDFKLVTNYERSF